MTSAARRILIVEDNEDSADSMALMLKFLGHEVSIEYDGPPALEAIRGKPPEVVLLDISLPSMSGFEVAQQIRQQSGQALYLVAVTGYGRDEEMLRSREAGFDIHILKPIDYDHLSQVLNTLPRNATATA
jgi:CheY-like chemotaxis protein